MRAPSFSYCMHNGPTAFCIELAGILAAEGAERLAQDWRSASEVIGEKQLVVDISFLTEIDPEGRELLLRLFRGGAAIVANMPKSRALTESIIGHPLPPVAPIPYTRSLYRSGTFFCNLLLVAALLVLLIPATASGQRLPIVQPVNNESTAFARYIAWLHTPDPFTESGPVALAVVATLPGLDKQGRLLAIRQVGESERSQYGILDLQGDSIVFERVIEPYLVAERQAEDRPLSSVLITPRNYNFRYSGAVETGDNTAYIFRITPKKARAGLIQGELWIESATGAPVLVTGHLVKTPSTSIRGINVEREIALVDGRPCSRTTRFMIETRPVGRAELAVIELPLNLPAPDAGPPSISGVGKP